jgi:hypothetical protein
LPLLARRGGCGSEEKTRSDPSAAAGVVVHVRESSSFDLDPPPRLALYGGFAKSFDALGTPPVQGLSRRGNCLPLG